jgi:hypothetical protein
MPHGVANAQNEVAKLRFAITSSFTELILVDERMSAAAPSTAHLYTLGSFAAHFAHG